MVNVGKYSIHGSYGIYTLAKFNIAPEKKHFQEEGSLAIIMFEGTMLNAGGVNLLDTFWSDTSGQTIYFTILLTKTRNELVGDWCYAVPFEDIKNTPCCCFLSKHILIACVFFWRPNLGEAKLAARKIHLNLLAIEMPTKNLSSFPRIASITSSINTLMIPCTIFTTGGPNFQVGGVLPQHKGVVGM